MALVVNTNLQALTALHKLNRTNGALGGVFERISSGMRINRAADDAAGFGMGEKFDAEYRGLKQALRNANDGISMIQTTEGATNEVANLIKRIRELAVQAASDTLGSDERAYANTEFVQLASEINRISQATTFNGVTLTSDEVAMNVQVGTKNTAADRIQFSTLNIQAGGTGGLGISSDDISLDTTTNAQQALEALDVALTSVNTYRANLGSSQNRIESAIRNLENYTENIAATKSRIMDADFAFETAQMAKFQILQQSGVAVLGQANAINQAALRLLG